jgi:membrane protein implicated in regulation of membrane protease activity
VIRRILHRFRDPVALVEAFGFGVVGAVIALLGPWRWLAVVALPLIALSVLVIATWPRRKPEPPEPERHIAALVHRWANLLKDNDPARAHAANAVGLAEGIEALILRYEHKIVRLDESAQEAATVSLRTVTAYATRSVDTYRGNNSAPVKASDWSALAEHLQDGYNALQDMLDRL